jgi:hypothetical protein
MIKVGDKVVVVIETIDEIAVAVPGITVVAINGDTMTLRDDVGEVITVHRDKVFATMEEAQAKLGVDDMVNEYDMGAPVRDGQHRTRT